MAGCGGDDDSSDDTGGGAGLGGGTYTITILNVDDQCFKDGAMSAVIIPDPANKPTIAGVALPAGGSTGTIPAVNFNAPFKPVVNVPVGPQGENGLVSTAPMVSLGTDINGDTTLECPVDVSFTASLVYATDDAFAGTATMTFGDLPADAENLCPELTGAAGCLINITISGAKE